MQRRFCRWRDKGIWAKLLELLIDETDFEWLMIDEKLGLKLEHGIPSHDTFERVFAMTDPKELERSFISWVKAVNRLTKRTFPSHKCQF